VKGNAVQVDFAQIHSPVGHHAEPEAAARADLIDADAAVRPVLQFDGHNAGHLADIPDPLQQFLPAHGSSP
jgi:hypothetical protein